MNRGRELFIAGSADDLAREAAARLVEIAHRAINERGGCSLAVSGGSTPRRLYQLLTQPPYRQAIDWSRVHIFFADERYVPHDDPDSTARLIAETLLAGNPAIAPEQVHAMPTEGEPEASAADYARTLAAFFDGQPPAFDLILLGMGPDGHTASLFPGRPDSDLSVAVVQDSPKPPPTRLTLTLPTIRAAREILFLVTGADKAATLEQIFHSDPDDNQALPAARVTGRDGRSMWLVDTDAGRGLHAFATL